MVNCLGSFAQTPQVQPNPAFNTITVVSDRVARISVTNVVGKLIIEVPAVAAETKIDISSWTAGFYFVEGVVVLSGWLSLKNYRWHSSKLAIDYQGAGQTAI
jgi:hypothetical protein